MQICITGQGVKISVKNGCFHSASEGAARTISPVKVSSFSIGSSCSITTAVILLAVKHNISVFFMEKGGAFHAQIWSVHYGSHAKVRKQQAMLDGTPDATRQIIYWQQLKLQGQARNVRHIARSRPSLHGHTTEALRQMRSVQEAFVPLGQELLETCANRIMGLEGSISKVYWELAAKYVRPEFYFQGRSRQPAADKFNAMLNYLYGCLYGLCENALLTAGLDPYNGLLHAEEYKTPALVFDFIEPFRPWADALVLQLCSNEDFPEHCFREEGGGIYLNRKGKHCLIPAWNECLQQRVRFEGRVITKYAAIYRLAQQFAGQLLEKEKTK